MKNKSSYISLLRFPYSHRAPTGIYQMFRSPCNNLLWLIAVVAICVHLYSYTYVGTTLTWQTFASEQQLCATPAKGNPYGTHRPPITSECNYHGHVDGLFQRATGKPRYMVIGGAGFVGSHLVKHLATTVQAAAAPPPPAAAAAAAAAAGGQVKVLDNFWSGALPNLQHDNGTWPIDPKHDVCAVELRNASDTLRFIRGADYVYYIADAFHGNSEIVTNVLQAVKANGINNFIYVGTAGCSAPAELSDLAGSAHMTVLQLHTVYGPGGGLSNTRHAALLPSLLRKALQQSLPLSLIGTKSAASQYSQQAWDFVYIDDVVDALLLARDKASKHGNQGSAMPIEIGTGKMTTKEQLTNMVDVVVATHLQQRDATSSSEDTSSADNGVQDPVVPTSHHAQHLLGWQPKTGLQQGIHKTLLWMAANNDNKRALVILFGQPRGGELPWKSMHRHLLVPLNAHMASFLIDADNAVVNQTLLYNMSQWVWKVPAHKDWGVVMDQAADKCHFDQNHTDQGDWRQLCNVHGWWVGGWKACEEQTGSAGIQQSYRWLVNQLILSLNLDKQYDVLVFTRPDHLYLCDHPKLNQLDTESVWVLSGEEHGGLCDRHLVGSANVMPWALNTTQELACFPKKYAAAFSERALVLKRRVNLEMVQARMWQEMGLKAQQFPRTAFTVRLPNDPASFAHRKRHAALHKYNLRAKYPTEMWLSRQTCNHTNVTFEQHLAHLHAYQVMV